MRVVLQAESGRRAGHRIWLGANQRLFVGGTEWAEFAVPGDPQLADVQFVVESDFEHCHIRNVHPDQALFVNGIKTEARTLVNGDIVTAGTTRFSVGIQQSLEAERLHDAIRANPMRQANPDLQYRFERCGSGLLRFYGSEPSQSPTEVAKLLAQQHCFYLVAHMQKSGLELPCHLTHVVDLSVRAEVDVTQLNPSSLVLLSASDGVERFQLLERSWGRDAIVGIFSTCERPMLIQSLLRSTLWVYPAHIIRDQLAGGTGTFIHDLFKGIRAILVESPAPGGWELFAHSQVDPLWMQLGFPNPPAARVTTGFSATGSSRSSIMSGSARPSAAGLSQLGGTTGKPGPDGNNVRLA